MGEITVEYLFGLPGLTVRSGIETQCVARRHIKASCQQSLIRPHVENRLFQTSFILHHGLVVPVAVGCISPLFQPSSAASCALQWLQPHSDRLIK